MKIQVIDGHETEVSDLRAIMDASGVVGTWDWDPIRRTVRYDEGAADLLAGDPALAGQDLPQSIAWATIHPADVDWLKDEIARLAVIGGIFLTEYRVISPDRGIRWILSRGRVYHDPIGRPIRGRGLLIDLTEARGQERGYFAKAITAADGPLDIAAEYCLLAHDALRGEGTPLLQILLKTILLELGREIGRDLRRRSTN